MIQVVYQKQGADRQLTPKAESYTLAQVRELAQAAGLLATVNGDVSSDESMELYDNDFVSFTEQVKGAAKGAKGGKSAKGGKATKGTKKK